jgi:phage antirepressor YoqD-like protein
MNELLPFSEKRMTVKEIAGALGTADSTIRNKARELFPDFVENGVTTLFDKEQVQAIKDALVPRTLTLKSKVADAVTELDIAEMTLKVISYHKGVADRLRAELVEAQPKIESHNALMRSELTMSITDAAKHFGLHPKTEVFPYLRAHNYLTKEDLPSQSAIDAGYLKLVQNPDRFGICHPQAVVATWQLENWRAHVVHQVKRWAGEIK